MEESFVVVYKSESASESASDGSGTHLPSPEGGPSSSLQPNNSGFHSTITFLKNAFEIATTQTQVEQPLCLECMRVLSDKLDKEVEDVTRDIEAYEACLQRLEGEPQDALSEADFRKEKLKEEKDAILAKTEVSQAHLELLKRTNVLNDAFPIWHDGEFGTINNFRLGRLPKIPVEWDEIIASWANNNYPMPAFAKESNNKLQCLAMSWSLKQLLKLRTERSSILSSHTPNVNTLWNEIRVKNHKVKCHSLLWFPHLIPKHSLIVWMAFLDRLPTKERPHCLDC
ncbi:Beclin-1-like protein [Hibiscus syriacus]|uniref:Beclin-1-like protein n=1 Tax=Hibiscus syriacus TaxID=106335 RepID=A0A6A3CFN5_HIBSY|nr:Beclin-1-like protein [Hibiscus syriacus]